jgi:hypothetical protein
MPTEDTRTEDTRIVLRTGGMNDPIVDHPGQPADYTHTDGTVWTWHKGWRPVGGVRDDKGRRFASIHLRVYVLVTSDADG